MKNNNKRYLTLLNSFMFSYTQIFLLKFYVICSSCWLYWYEYCKILHLTEMKVITEEKGPPIPSFDRCLGLGLWCLPPLSTIFQLYHYHGGQFYWWRTPEYPEKTTDKLSHNVVSSTPHLSGIQTHNFNGDRHWLQK